jgi:hypothetical protein
VNPDHLEPVTGEENMRRMWQRRHTLGWLPRRRTDPYVPPATGWLPVLET